MNCRCVFKIQNPHVFTLALLRRVEAEIQRYHNDHEKNVNAATTLGRNLQILGEAIAQHNYTFLTMKHAEWEREKAVKGLKNLLNPPKPL